MSKNKIVAPEHTAVRVALWRALHIQVDASPHVFCDEIGLKLVDEKDWLQRQDMNPQFSKAMRASIVARARFVEDLVEEKIKQGIRQYVILGAGLDTFAQRRPDLSHLQIFEIDQPGPQEWKKNRLLELGFPIPSWLHFVPVDFESGPSWWEQLIASGFNPNEPAVVVSTGVSLYLTPEANFRTLRQLAQMAPHSTFAMTFMLSPELLEQKERSMLEFVMKKAQDSGTPFLGLFTPSEILSQSQKSGFKTSQYISAKDLYQRYFSHRTDDLKAGDAEAFLVAST